MEVCTGASVSLMSQTTQQQLFPEQTLEKPAVRLTTYIAESISVVGKREVQVKYRSYSGTHTLYVVQGEGPTLLGRDWLQHIQLDWKSLGVAHVARKPATLSEVLSVHEEVFAGGLGLMNQFEAKLMVKPGASPRFCRARPVPFALKEPIERELDRLEDSGVLEKVSHSDWAAPIVAVPKSDGTIRLCGDYKVTVNQDLEID